MLASLSLLLAVTTMQAPPAPAPSPAPRAHRRAHAITIAPFAASAAELEAAAAGLACVQPDSAMRSAKAPVLARSAQALRAPVFALSAAPVAMAGGFQELAGLAALAGLADLAGLAALADVGDFTFDMEDEPEPRWPQDEASTQADVADSVYRAARRALNQNQYQQAAELFRRIRDRYARSTYVPNTYYWEAFALYRAGSDDNLRAARTALRAQADRYPKATTSRDARVLLRRVQGELARRGDSDAAEDISREAESAAPAIATTPVTPQIAIAPVGATTVISAPVRPGRE